MRRLLLAFAFFAIALTASGQAINPLARTVNNATTDPAFCSPTAVNIFLNTTTDIFKICTASNTWTPLATTGATQTFSYAALTAGTLTATNSAQLGTFVSRYDWTNAMIVALGGVLAGDLTVATLQAKTVVRNAYVVIDTPDTSANALTVAFGRVSATYIDYIVASDAKAAANTVYGDVSGERGTNLTGFDLPSITTTTVVKLHFIKTTTFLNSVTGSTGHVYIVYSVLP